MEENVIINQHNKAEYPPMHTTEHILNQTMVKMFGCKRSHNAHIERKKSKCDYWLAQPPTVEEVESIQEKVNEIISQHLPITIDFIPKEEAIHYFDLGKLPENVSEVLRIVRIGDYDSCPCIGSHVNNTSEIGIFQIISHDYKEGVWRVRFKLLQ